MAWVLIGWLIFHSHQEWQLLFSVLHPDKHCDSSNIHHPVTVYDSMVLYLHSLICSSVWSLMKHKDKFTFTSSIKQMTLYTTVYCRIQEKCHNQWIHTNIWKGNNHITSMIWCSCIKTFPTLDSTESRRHKLHQKDPTHNQNVTISRVLFAQGGSTSYIHHTMSTKSTINDTTFSSGIIKKIKKKERKQKKTPFLFFE